MAIEYDDINSLNAILNGAEITPHSTSLIENVNNLLNNLIYACPNLNQGLTDYLDSTDFTQDQPSSYHKWTTC